MSDSKIEIEEKKPFAEETAKKGPEPEKKPLYTIENPPTGDRVSRFLEAFAAILRHSNYRFLLDIYAKTTAKCGRCATACQVFLATGDPRHIPCYRTYKLIEIYKRHFTYAGKMKARLTGNPGLTEEDIDEMLESFYQCTACRRCVMNCPMNIDHALLTRLGRYILSETGIMPRALRVSVRAQLEGEAGNTSAITRPAMLDTLEFLEEEITDARGIEFKFPVDVEGAEFAFFPPVSDLMMEAETIMGIALMLHQSGTSWTFGTGNYDAINYGLFYSDEILGRVLSNLLEEMKRLKAKDIMIGECGHASRVARDFSPTFGEGSIPRIVNIVEHCYRMLKEGKIELDPDTITERVTYHDPCNIARSGWLVDQPREVVRAMCKNFVEMTPRGTENICCGGGGGTVSIDELKEYRMTIGGKVKAEQIKKTGAEIVVAPCANCKKQLRELMEFYEMPVQIVGVHDLVLKAIKIR